MAKQFNEHVVVEELKKKHDLRIQNKQILELMRNPKGKGAMIAKGDVGIKSKGKIDFLTRNCGYVHMFVNNF